VEAVRATALAYYNKNPLCQYDESHLTAEETYRNSVRSVSVWEESPEYASFDQYYYAVCNSYVMAIYNDAFGYRYDREDGIPYFTRQFGTMNGPEIVYKSTNNSELNIERVIADVKAIAEPGDIVVGYGKTGHALLCLGDLYGDGTIYYTHCWGANMADDGKDRYEDEGAIKIQPEDEVLYGAGKPNWDLHNLNHSSEHVVIYRPFAAADFPTTMTKKAETRLQYPGLVIDRRLDVQQFATVLPGQKLKLTTVVQNRGTEAYRGLEIAENLPEGVKLLSGERTVTVDVDPGETVAVSLEVEVNGLPGTYVTFPKGRVGNIPTRRITVELATSVLSAEQAAALDKAGRDAALKGGRTEKELALAKALYKEATGIELALPDTVQEFLDAVTEVKSVGGVSYLVPKSGEPSAESAYLMRMMFGGKYRLAEGRMYERILDIRELYFEPGDIIIRLTGEAEVDAKKASGVSVILYLGEGVSLNISRSVLLEEFRTVADYLLSANNFLVLRPALAAAFN